MAEIKTKEQIGRQASIEGFANEKILCGILMKKYANVSLVDLPLSSYDIIIAKKIDEENEEIIRIQSKTATKSVKFTSGSRGGVDRKYISDIKTYTQSPKHSDCVVGVHFENNKVDLYFVPTVLIKKIGTKSISLSKIQALKNNYEILENCKNKSFVLSFFKKVGIIKP